jgi:pyruvate/2-oxoglutarate dehydrogenase complex dihydrolipoamide acyltransferase (E2) component
MGKAVNDLGNRAKMGKLNQMIRRNYTVTNVGTFGSVLTPTINQPQVGILALAIRKVPAVIETQKEILSVFVKECSAQL